MSSFNSKDELSESGNDYQSNETVETNNPPPYQEAASISSPRRPPLRTLRVEYDEGSFPKRLQVFDTTRTATNLGQGHQPLYWAKLHTSKLLGGGGAHMEFKKTAPHDDDEEIGRVKFHKLGSARIDLTFHDGPSTTMSGYAGTTYSMMYFTCPSAGDGGQKRLQWQRPGQEMSLICVDPDENDENSNNNDKKQQQQKKVLASIHFGALSDPVGEIAVEDHELGRSQRWVEEIIVSGLAYVHLSRYMSNYAGGRSSIGVGMT